MIASGKFSSCSISKSIRFLGTRRTIAKFCEFSDLEMRRDFYRVLHLFNFYRHFSIDLDVISTVSIKMNNLSKIGRSVVQKVHAKYLVVFKACA